MEAFAVRDLRKHTGELVRKAESGQFSVVSKHDRPLFVALPFTDELLRVMAITKVPNATVCHFGRDPKSRSPGGVDAGMTRVFL